MSSNFALNQGTIRHLPLEQALATALKAGFQGFGVWSECVFDEIKRGQSEDVVCEKIRNTKMKIIELIHLKEWLFVEGVHKKNSIRSMEILCRMAKKMGATHITAPAYGVKGKKNIGIQNFKDYCDIANHYNVKVAIEFVPCFKIGNLLSAYELVDAINRQNSGIVVDTFHVFKGSTALYDFNDIPIDKIALIHLCDGSMHGTQRAFLEEARGYRLFPGQGCFDLNSLILLLKNKNYQGDYSLEVLNKDFINQDPDKVVQEGMASLNLLFNGQNTGNGVC